MTEYVEKRAVLGILQKHSQGTWRGIPVYSEETRKARDEIEKLPITKGKDLKQGHWIQFWCNARGIRYGCSVCGLSQAQDFNYCPECGACMNGGQES